MPHGFHNTLDRFSGQRTSALTGGLAALAGRAFRRYAALLLGAALLAGVAFAVQPGATASAKPLGGPGTPTIIGLFPQEAATSALAPCGADVCVVSATSAAPSGLTNQHLVLAGDAAAITAVGVATPAPVSVSTWAAGAVYLRLHYTEPLPANAPDESRLAVFYSSTTTGPWTRLDCTTAVCTQDTTNNTILFDLTTAGFYVVAAPETSSITISPNPAKPYRGDSVQFTAQVLDYEGVAVSGATVTWEALPAVGTITGGGLFVATATSGTYAGAVTARYGTLSASADVQVQYYRRYIPASLLGWSMRVRPNDPGYVLEPNMAQVQANMAWSATKGSGGPIIAIVDSGVDLHHPDLAANIVPGYDFVNNDASADDDNGHGTHVAGIVGAVGNNGVGVAGMNWTARIMPVKVLNRNGSGDPAAAAQGIRWAADNGARVINLSLGASGSMPQLEAAVAYAISKGCVVVAASGNVSSDAQKGIAMYPAAYPGVVGVGAVDGNGTVASFSNTGAFLDVVAPGVRIYSTYYLNTYAFLSGTSMASPHVAGLAGLVLAAKPWLTGDQVRSAIVGSARDLGPAGWDQAYGYGIIDSYRAIVMAGSSAATLNEPDVAVAAAEPAVLQPGTYNPGVLWVQVQQGLSAAAVLGDDTTLSGMAADAYVPNLVRVNVEPGTEAEAMQRLQQTPCVEAVYPDYILFAQ